MCHPDMPMQARDPPLLPPPFAHLMAPMVCTGDALGPLAVDGVHPVGVREQEEN